jgi:hypothetical protein
VTPGSDDNPAEGKQGPQEARKPYQPPSLRSYGSLARITESVGFMGKLDGGMAFFMRRTA